MSGIEDDARAATQGAPVLTSGIEDIARRLAERAFAATHGEPALPTSMEQAQGLLTALDCYALLQSQLIEDGDESAWELFGDVYDAWHEVHGASETPQPLVRAALTSVATALSADPDGWVDLPAKLPAPDFAASARNILRMALAITKQAPPSEPAVNLKALRASAKLISKAARAAKFVSKAARGCMDEKSEAAAEKNEGKPSPNQPTARFLSSKDLAGHLSVSYAAVDSALRAFATAHPDSRESVLSPKKGEPRYLYRVEAVWPLLLAKLPRWEKATTD